MSNELRVGVFGSWRGRAYMKSITRIDGMRLTAVCDKDTSKFEKAKEHFEGEVALFTDFYEFIDSGLFDAVFLCNYFSEHAEFAIEALKRKIHVFSETMVASTMAKCVALCRAVEESGCVYMMAENYPYTRGALELKRLYDGGTMGKVMFAEGEYVHPMSPSENKTYTNPETNGEYHWRRYLPATYYSSHALAPLMHMTGTMPKKVIGKTVLDTAEHAKEFARTRADLIGVMLVEMDNGALFRVNGSTYIPPHANWYRLGCVDGAAETLRENEKKVRITYNKWSTPEGEETERIYDAEWECDAEKAEGCGHSGSDYFVVKEFLAAVRDGKKVFPDVYQATAMAATAILGWRSVLKGSKQMNVPDFRRERDRKKWENDDLTPFPAEGRPNTLPYSTIPVEDLK